ncbi:MAG: hypothetical protein JXA38_04705 [Methanosarcinaceae archaeon]|nr:hypothetical protein [Methanosarcinaceae archaeon]
MVSFKHLAIMALILVGLTVSGCLKQLPEESVPEELSQEERVSVVDDVLSDELVGLTDAEIKDLENDIYELEAMLEDLNLDEDLLLEEI